MLTLDQCRPELQSGNGSLENALSNDAKWAAVLSRNASYDGAFVFGVRTTGIYCRPSCPAKRPKRENAVFFAGPVEAERSGFRACRRCNPKDAARLSGDRWVYEVCAFIDANLGKRLTLSTLAAQAKLSPFYFQRTFKKVLGVSPRQYVEARRLAKMKRFLRDGDTVNNSLYNAGFSSRSRVYEKIASGLGVNPGAIRQGGRGLRIQYTIVASPIGRLLIGATERGVCAVCMGDSDRTVEMVLAEDYPAASLHRNDKGMKEWAGAFLRYLAGRSSSLRLPLDVTGTAFQWKVWKKIQSIPYGKTATYSGIADALGAPQASRAVARACATNPVALVIPCHRVIGKDGGLHGYRWGNERKLALLDLEGKASESKQTDS
ncbi:MAG TPA: bifunctional DNA-binding transcriptional regulator/O6-methylguanine-DNA methyltransferase Ada [Candidatus Bathyarchaeia archaeon]|nr:bifunctional DNA-binding transcriptional regulator/O6-methylguanine-DNA methyltransferase Ada [Candidatus Bathyarchaeia archaeon]